MTNSILCEGDMPWGLLGIEPRVHYTVTFIVPLFCLSFSVCVCGLSFTNKMRLSYSNYQVRVQFAGKIKAGKQL